VLRIKRIQLNNFRFFIDDKNHNSFELNGKNMLLYGENGSGKSSIFKAFEFLAQTKIDRDDFLETKNIFSDKNPSIIFTLENGKVVNINENSLENNSAYIKALEIYKPMLEYKNLLKIHYQTDKTREKINIYEILREIFKEYPLENGTILGNIRNPDIYFETLKNIINSKILNGVNSFLKLFDNNFYINEFYFDKEFTEDGRVEFIVNIKIDFMNNRINVYQNFLNEARLSALAIAIYFTTIRNVSDRLQNSSLKLLVLDDLLMSLDMSNRLTLINLLKVYFNDFQIFLFTHDKSFFEILKDKMSWRSYEIYVKKDDKNREVPYIKNSLNYFESAKKYFNEYDYPACSNYLRKEVERLKKIKERQEQSIYNEDKILKKLKKVILKSDLTDESKIGQLRGKLIGFKKGLEKDITVEINLNDIKSITDRILNPQSHDDTSKPLYKKELKEAIDIIERIRKEI
jgi:ABC-type multidrug transport system ATPase subunit